MQQVLPFDGEALYFGAVMDATEAGNYFDLLSREIPWMADTVMMFGKRLTLERSMSWHGDHGLVYTYSGLPRVAQPWTPALTELKSKAEALVGAGFNSCLLNYYLHGGQSMGWHSDNEAMLGPQPIIASLSLGAERPFVFKHRKTGEKVSLLLENGSLLLMRGDTQHQWRHALPKTVRVKKPRINLTFRTIIL